jgi:hypothetical protein
MSSSPLVEFRDRLIETLLTDRTGEKGDRDLLVVAGLLSLMTGRDVDELVLAHGSLAPELRHQVCANLTVLSLLPGRAGMPDPVGVRARIADLVRRLAP